MREVRIVHPDAAPSLVQESAVAEHTRAGWLVDESEAPVPCHACGQTLPSKSPPDPEPDQAPAESGASSSPAPRGRRRSNRESE